MANRNSRAKAVQLRKEKKHFHGQACPTSFANKSGANKRRSPWKGGGKQTAKPTPE